MDDRAEEVLTEFDQDMTAKTVRVVPKPGDKKRPFTLTRIYDGGVEVGEIAWVPAEKLLMWNFKGLTKGAINEETLKKTPSGGWTFQPTIARLNVLATPMPTRRAGGSQCQPRARSTLAAPATSSRRSRMATAMSTAAAGASDRT